MIRSFANEGTRDIFDGTNSKAARALLPPSLWKAAARKMEWLRVAVDKRDLRSPPGYRFEELKGDLAGKCSVRINEQYRLVFRFDGDVHDLEISKHYE